LDNSTKLGNLGRLVDVAFAKHKSTFASQAAFMGLINGMFAVLAMSAGWLGLAVVWPAIPNFTGNQTITDGIILGVFSIIMLLIVAFFLAWQSAATIVVCKYKGQPNTTLQTTIRGVLKSALPALSVLFALILIFVPFLAIFALVVVFNLSAIFDLAPPLLVVLFMILVMLRTFAFFAVNMAVNGEHRFLSAIINSTKVVMQRGPIRIFAITGLITTINLGLFLVLFAVFLSLFGQYPADLFEFLVILYNPMGIAALLFLAHLVTIFITPKTQILAFTLYNPSEVETTLKSPGLASRSLSAALDMAIIGAIFIAAFFGAATLFSGGLFAFSQMNVFATFIASFAFFVVFAIYNSYYEVFGGGQTPAKRIFGLVVRDHEGGDIGIFQSLVRNVMRVADIFGFVAIALDSEHRRVGDLLSLAKVEYKKEEGADVSR